MAAPAPIVALQVGLQQRLTLASAIDFPDPNDIVLPSDVEATALANFFSRAALVPYLATLTDAADGRILLHGS
jgi:hypothetical protein